MDPFARMLTNGAQRYQGLIPATWTWSPIGKDRHVDVLKPGIWRWGESAPGPSRCAQVRSWAICGGRGSLDTTQRRRRCEGGADRSAGERVQVTVGAKVTKFLPNEHSRVLQICNLLCLFSPFFNHHLIAKPKP